MILIKILIFIYKRVIMSKQMNIEELKTLIAKEIKSKNLHQSLPEDAVEKIKNKILSVRDHGDSQNMPDVVSELDTPTLNYPTDDTASFPDQSQVIASPEQQIDVSGSTDSFQVAAGSEQTGQPSQPTTGYMPELPTMLQKAEPSELFVFRYNDVVNNSENLSNKPMRLMDEPDVMKSMRDMWIEHGKTRAKVYVAKFEEIGEIKFDYSNGTSKFTEKASMPDHQSSPVYNENPYLEESLPQIEGDSKSNLETYIKSSVDLEKVVHDIVMGIVKDSLLTNTEKAVNSQPELEEDIAIVQDRPGYGADTTQMVKPMEENSFNMTMEDIVKDDGFERITLPKALNENISSGDTSLLVNENEFIREWRFENKSFYTPVSRVSKDKGYIKL